MGSHFDSIIKTNVDAKDPHAGMPVGENSRVVRYYNDFFEYAAAEWVITTTEAGGGSATEILDPQDQGGALVLLNDTNDADSNEFQKAAASGVVHEAWTLTSGQRTSFSCRFKVNDADDVDAMVGLVITDTAMIDGTTDGIYFRIVEAAAGLTLVCEKDSTETILAILTAADDTYHEVGFSYDGNSTVTAFSRGSDTDKWIKVGTITTNLPDNEQLALSFAIQNGAAAADSMTMDYLDIRQERS